MAKFTCPFCIRTYKTSDALYVCPDPGCGEISLPRFGEREPIKCKRPGCGGLATKRQCPHCGNEIPRMALDTPNLPFSIVGVPNSGKTNFITVMLHELSRTFGSWLVLGSQTRETRENQNENYRLIYEDHVRPPSTHPGEPIPQIWFIRNLRRQRGDSVPTYTFTIFDGAGEDHEDNLDPNSDVCHYISASKAVILVIDPLVLSQVRKGGVVDPEVMRNSLAGSEGETKNAVDIINSVAAYIKTARGIKSSKMLDIPVAVVLTKIDTILDHQAFGPQALIKGPGLSQRDGVVDLTEIKQVDSEIRGWLEAIGETAFITALRSHFKEFYFFGVSSYGSPPQDFYRLAEDIRPHRVLDPILWLFKRFRFID